MNLLLDQNISFRVVQLISSAFENVKQVKQIGLTDALDVQIWDYAFKHGYSIITFDSDFIELSNLKGFPPKIIWLRLGNSSNLKIANKVLSKSAEIAEFLLRTDLAFLEID